jgi:hypothetical protein
LPIPLIKKENIEFRLQRSEAPDTKVYSCGIKALKYLAPAIPQRAALLLMLQITSVGIEATF